MTEEKPRFPREIAIGVARELCELLKPVRSRLIVAGSLLRRKTSVGDMEILFIPRRETRQVDMLSCESVSPAEEAVAQLLAAGAIQKRGLREGTFYWGPKNKLAAHCTTGVPVDLFNGQRRQLVESGKKRNSKGLTQWLTILCASGVAGLKVMTLQRTSPKMVFFPKIRDLTAC